MASIFLLQLDKHIIPHIEYASAMSINSLAGCKPARELIDMADFPLDFALRVRLYSLHRRDNAKRESLWLHNCTLVKWQNYWASPRKRYATITRSGYWQNPRVPTVAIVSTRPATCCACSVSGAYRLWDSPSNRLKRCLANTFLSTNAR